MWVLANLVQPGTPDPNTNEATTLPGSNISYDCYGNGWNGGEYLMLWGLDAAGNVIYSPTTSAQVTKNL